MNVTFNNHKQGIVAVELISASPRDDEALMIVSVASVPFVQIFPSHNLTLPSQSVWGSKPETLPKTSEHPHCQEPYVLFVHRVQKL